MTRVEPLAPLEPQVRSGPPGPVRNRSADRTAAVTITLDPQHLDCSPGCGATAAFTVHNLGTRVEEFSLTLEGVRPTGQEGSRPGGTAPAGLPSWLSVAPNPMTIYPGQAVSGTITAAPAGTPPPAAGTTTFRLVVEAETDKVRAAVGGDVTVAPVHDVTAKLIPTTSRGWGTTAHTVVLQNRGNTQARVALVPMDPDGVLALHYDPELELDPGASADSALLVQAPIRWFGRPKQMPFEVTAQSEPQPPIRMPGQRVDLPRFSTVALVAAAGLGLVLATIAGLALMRMSDTDKEPIVAAQQTVSPTGEADPEIRTASALPTTGEAAPPTGPTSASPAGTKTATRRSIPDVAQLTAEQARQRLKDAGLTSRENPQFNNSVLAGQVISSEPGAGAVPEPGQPVVLNVSKGPTPRFDLIEQGPRAVWRSGTGERIEFDGSEDDTDGFVGVRENALLRNGIRAERGLEARPEQRPGGVLSGRYTLPNRVIRGDYFIARVGFLDGGTGSVRFEVIAGGSRACQDEVLAGFTAERSESTVHAFKIDLSRCAGAGTIWLRTRVVGAEPERGAVWLNPAVEGAL